MLLELVQLFSKSDGCRDIGLTERLAIRLGTEIDELEGTPGDLE